MNIFEFENEQFNGLWTDEAIAECQKSVPQRTSGPDIFPADELAEEKYREFNEANWTEYFDFAHTYKYCLWR